MLSFQNWRHAVLGATDKSSSLSPIFAEISCYFLVLAIFLLQTSALMVKTHFRKRSISQNAMFYKTHNNTLEPMITFQKTQHTTTRLWPLSIAVQCLASYTQSGSPNWVLCRLPSTVGGKLTMDKYFIQPHFKSYFFEMSCGTLRAQLKELLLCFLRCCCAFTLLSTSYKLNKYRTHFST